MRDAFDADHLAGTRVVPVQFAHKKAGRQITSRELRRQRQQSARGLAKAGRPVGETARRMVQRWSTEHYLEVIRDAHALGLGEITTRTEYLRAMRAGFRYRAARRAEARNRAARGVPVNWPQIRAAIYP